MTSRILRRPLSPLFLAAALAVAGSLFGGCAGASMERVDPSQDDDLGGTMIDSADVIAATDQAVAELSDVLLKMEQNGIKIAAATIKNESAQPFNTALLSDRMINGLVRNTAPRVGFLAREQIDEIVREREAQEAGVYTSTKKLSLLGADYLLTGRILSLSKRYEGDRADYFVLGFRLVSLDSTILWTQQYEFKKVGDSGVIYQ